MKILFFKHNKNSKINTFFVNITIAMLVAMVGVVSFLSPTISVAYLKEEGAIYQGNIDNNNVSIMINVCWGTEFIEPMLDILHSNDAVATFFVGGSWVAQNNDVFALISNSNNEIGNHGYNHKDHAKISKNLNIEEISNTHSIVKNLSNKDMKLFAPPSGSYNSTTLKVASSLGYKTIMWSKDTIDWRDKNADIIFERATKKLANGDLILMHPTKETLSVFDKMIKEIKSQGFNLVTVSKNIEGI
jgi:peptidoglycan/xylan/chitin deacetylase (PgdA/CDA1 family)